MKNQFYEGTLIAAGWDRFDSINQSSLFTQEDEDIMLDHKMGIARFKPFFNQKVRIWGEIFSDERNEIMVLLHRISAKIEDEAIKRGYPETKAFAGGSCKDLFCKKHDACRVLNGKSCRYPESARPSMSGFGIDVAHLMKISGWKSERADSKADKDETSWIAGLVLIA